MEELEQEVLDELENPYRPYSVISPYEVRFTIPDDGHNTEITIRTRSEEVRFGRNERDILLQKEIDNRYGRDTYSKHILDSRNFNQSRGSTPSPSASMPWTWKMFFARSTPIVITSFMGGSYFPVVPKPQLWHIAMPLGGSRPLHHERIRQIRSSCRGSCLTPDRRSVR
jgi:hypothetical protein